MSIVDSSQNPKSFIQTLQMLADPEEVQRRFQALIDKQTEVEKLLALVGPAKAEAQLVREEALAARDAVLASQAELQRLQGVLNDKMVEVNDQIVRNKRLADEHEDAKRGYARSLASLQDIAAQFSAVLGKF